MNTYYLDFTITVAVEAVDEQDALKQGEKLTAEEIVKEGEWNQDFVIFDDEFNEVFRD